MAALCGLYLPPGPTPPAGPTFVILSSLRHAEIVVPSATFFHQPLSLLTLSASFAFCVYPITLPLSSIISPLSFVFATIFPSSSITSLLSYTSPIYLPPGVIAIPTIL